MKDKIIYTLLNRLPQNLVSRSFGVLSEVALPPTVQGLVNRGFASMTGINTLEGELPPQEYKSLNAFFTRRLRPHARPIEPTAADSVISPVDGRLDQFGLIEQGTLIQAKGRHYTVCHLLDSFDHATPFNKGSFSTLYLSPKDYHRVHAPVSGKIHEISYIPGRLWPVKPWAVAHVEDLFAVNERLVTYIDTNDFGRVACVMVGATCVGKMTLSFNDFATNSSFRLRQEITLDPGITIQAGDELGCFNLGSTVILLFEKRVDFNHKYSVGSPIQMGHLFATPTQQNQTP